MAVKKADYKNIRVRTSTTPGAMPPGTPSPFDPMHITSAEVHAMPVGTVVQMVGGSTNGHFFELIAPDTRQFLSYAMPTTSWKDLGATPPPVDAIEGDVFINLHDRRAWAFDGAVWQPARDWPRIFAGRNMSQPVALGSGHDVSVLHDILSPTWIAAADPVGLDLAITPQGAYIWNHDANASAGPYQHWQRLGAINTGRVYVVAPIGTGDTFARALPAPVSGAALQSSLAYPGSMLIKTGTSWADVTEAWIPETDTAFTASFSGSTLTPGDILVFSGQDQNSQGAMTDRMLYLALEITSIPGRQAIQWNSNRPGAFWRSFGVRHIQAPAGHEDLGNGQDANRRSVHCVPTIIKAGFRGPSMEAIKAAAAGAADFNAFKAAIAAW